MKRVKELIRLTKKRLYAYPQLKENIEEYKKNIEDLKKEEFGKSKSIILFRSGSTVEPPTIEEIREKYIRQEEAKKECDEKEVRMMERALKKIKRDAYYRVIEMSFFEEKNEEEIAEELKISKVTVYRVKGKLIDKMNIVLYGAKAIEI